jgi:type II secretory pathway pseudopilin PulG
MRQPGHREGFNLLEVVIVAATIAILAVVGLPRTSRGSGAAHDSTLRSSLTVLRRAIDLYAAEHRGAYPTADKIEEALTLYSDASGATSVMKTTSHIYGPYVCAIPPLPVGSHEGQTAISTADGPEIGWIYNPSTGAIRPNATDQEKDAADKLYNSY